jgi:hypothetical protein
MKHRGTPALMIGSSDRYVSGQGQWRAGLNTPLSVLNLRLSYARKKSFVINTKFSCESLADRVKSLTERIPARGMTR